MTAAMTCGLGLQIQVGNAMQDVETFPGALGYLHRVQALRPRLQVHVAAHGHHGRNALQSAQHLRRPQVSGVQNQFTASERFLGFGSKQSMGVADYANGHARIVPDRKLRMKRSAR